LLGFGGQGQGMGGVHLIVADQLGEIVQRLDRSTAVACPIGDAHGLSAQCAKFVKSGGQGQHSKLGPHRPDGSRPVAQGKRIPGERHRLGLGIVRPGPRLSKAQAQVPSVQFLALAQIAPRDGPLHPLGQRGGIGDGRQAQRFIGRCAQVGAGLGPVPGLLAVGGNLGRRRAPVDERLGDSRVGGFTLGWTEGFDNVGAKKIVLQRIPGIGLDQQAAGKQFRKRRWPVATAAHSSAHLSGEEPQLKLWRIRTSRPIG
jgi:hypothetical protein